MTFRFLGPDALEDQVEAVLRQLATGAAPADIELAQVDVKEERGRRNHRGVLQPGRPQNDEAARALAEELACLANTPGGGALIVGVADDGTRTGAELDAQWLRHRVWQLTEQRLTVNVREAELDGTRILVVTTHEAIEPIRYNGRLKWRVNDNCVEIDASTWHGGRLHRTGVDWSAQRSGHRLEDVNPVAVEVARRYLRDAGDPPAADLAAATAEDLLRRLNLVDGDGWLTNAGSLLFVGTPASGIDYIRRDVPAGDSVSRIAGDGPLIEQVWDVDKASLTANRLAHVPGGFAHGQMRALPARAVREAIVNGVVHRDWASPLPTSVEHIGDTLTVTSPGGFIGGVHPSNIITHPAVPRYRSLAEAMAALRLAEREGIGVDRMVRDMLAVGHPEPEISEVEGPYVRVGLLGGDPDSAIVEFVANVTPATFAADVDGLLVVDHLLRHGWADVKSVAPVLQRPPEETGRALARLAEVHIGADPVIVPIAGVPADAPAAYRLSDMVRDRLTGRFRPAAGAAARAAMILSWARARGRVSSTEVADLAGVSVVTAGKLLAGLEEDGDLVAGRENRQGRGFYYVAAG